MAEVLLFLQKIFFFLMLISIVVVVHEFGHFIVARLCGVGVEAFALFMGRPIFKWKRGRTEWRIGMIPIGGYVKMIGQSDTGHDGPDAVPEELRGLSFAHKPLWARAAIVAAGPLMNVVLAFVIFSGMFVAGYPVTTTLVGDVAEDGAADKGGLRPGDRVTAIDGAEVWRWEDMAEIVERSAGRALVFTVDRGGEKVNLTITPELARKKNIFQFDADAGVIGIGQDGFLPIIGVADPASPAALAGLHTGDLVKSVNGREVRYFADFERAIAAASGPTSLTVERGGLSRLEEERKPVAAQASVEMPAVEDRMRAVGIDRGDLFVLEVLDGSPALQAGVQPGDRILAANGTQIAAWPEFTKIVRESPSRPIALTVLREGRRTELSVTPDLIIDKDMLGDEVKFGRVGLYPWISSSGPEVIFERYWNPIRAIGRGLDMTWHWTVLNIKGFVYLIRGDVSVKTLGGPIMIADLAGKSAQAGAFSFIMFIAIISLSLAILNLMPIPVLDGGHIALFAIEGLIRRPLPETGQRIVTNIGLFLVGSLMVAVIFNDLTRVFPGLRTLFGLLD